LLLLIRAAEIIIGKQKPAIEGENLNTLTRPFLILTCALLALSACAPVAVVKPIPADTPPDKVLSMAQGAEEGIKGLRAAVRVTVHAEGRGAEGFDGVLYVGRPDNVRLTGLALLGVTVFDAVIRGGKFYFYQPSEGYLYTGPTSAMAGFLEERGVKADPEVIYRSLMPDRAGQGERYMVDRTDAGYEIYIVRAGDGPLTPRVREDYDPGLNLVQKVFYDELARPYIFVRTEGMAEAGGFRLPERLKAVDKKNGYTVTVDFQKYIVNPENAENDFMIQGGEFKGIREIQ
jgi:hypothetical protein